MHLLPLQRHTRETSLSTWLPMPALQPQNLNIKLLYIFRHFLQKTLKVLHKNLMRAEYFEICTLKLIKKLLYS